ncbi:type IV pilus biogenesis protein PilP, partial [Escherichia coli]|uniref:type IV pilus biogenesis protein PilP n=1 Tax=Escherichia coli TaxID=562 RepID=UPI000C1C13B4
TCIFSHPVYLFLREFSLQDSRGGSPRLTAIFGVQPQLTARIELPGGSISDVKAGQNIPGTTYHVEKITPDSVVLEQSGTRKTLRP